LTAYKGYSYILVTGSRVFSFSVYYQVCRGGGRKQMKKTLIWGFQFIHYYSVYSVSVYSLNS